MKLTLATLAVASLLLAGCANPSVPANVAGAGTDAGAAGTGAGAAKGAGHAAAVPQPQVPPPNAPGAAPPPPPKPAEPAATAYGLPILSGITVDGVSGNGADVHWVVDGSKLGDVQSWIEYGRDAGQLVTSTGPHAGKGAFQEGLVGVDGTSYYFRVVASGPGGRVQSDVRGFTGADPPEHHHGTTDPGAPADPIEPTDSEKAVAQQESTEPAPVPKQEPPTSTCSQGEKKPFPQPAKVADDTPRSTFKNLEITGVTSTGFEVQYDAIVHGPTQAYVDYWEKMPDGSFGPRMVSGGLVLTADGHVCLKVPYDTPLKAGTTYKVSSHLFIYFAHDVGGADYRCIMQTFELTMPK